MSRSKRRGSTSNQISLAVVTTEGCHVSFRTELNVVAGKVYNGQAVSGRYASLPALHRLLPIDSGPELSTRVTCCVLMTCLATRELSHDEICR